MISVSNCSNSILDVLDNILTITKLLRTHGRICRLQSIFPHRIGYRVQPVLTRVEQSGYTCAFEKSRSPCIIKTGNPFPAEGRTELTQEDLAGCP